MMYGTYHRFAEYYDVSGDMNHAWLDDNNEYHNEGGPAHICFLGIDESRWRYQEKWYRHGKQHREDGPALINYNGRGQIMTEGWYLNNQCHRIDGPAIKSYINDGKLLDEAWYLNNREYISFGEWFKDTPLPLHEKVEMKLTWG